MKTETDINYLLHRQQMSLIHAQVARSQEGRVIYERLARNYIDRVLAYRRENQKVVVPAL